MTGGTRKAVCCHVYGARTSENALGHRERNGRERRHRRCVVVRTRPEVEALSHFCGVGEVPRVARSADTQTGSAWARSDAAARPGQHRWRRRSGGPGERDWRSCWANGSVSAPSRNCCGHQERSPWYFAVPFSTLGGGANCRRMAHA